MSSPHKKTRSPAYLRFRRRLITGLLSLAVLTTAVVASQFRTSYLEREHSIQVQTEHYVKAMEAHVTYSIQSVDLSLIGFANAIKFLSAKQSRSPETMTELLSSRESCFNSDYWITFIDPTGNAIATSISNIVIGANYKDRDYFTSTSLTAPRANYSWESHRSA